MNQRIDKLKELSTANPTDPFPRYGLAMEYRNSGRVDEAAGAFVSLIEDHPDYLASYLHCGLCLEETGNPERAAEVYRAGIEVANRQQNLRARQELEAALEMV